MQWHRKKYFLAFYVLSLIAFDKVVGFAISAVTVNKKFLIGTLTMAFCGLYWFSMVAHFYQFMRGRIKFAPPMPPCNESLYDCVLMFMQFGMVGAPQWHYTTALHDITGEKL